MADFSAAQSNSSSHLKCGIGYGSNLGGIANIGNFTLFVFGVEGFLTILTRVTVHHTLAAPT